MSQPNTLHKKRFHFPIFDAVNVLIMLFVIVVMLYPFLNTVAISFNDAQDTLRGGIGLWPRVFSAYSYEMVFKSRLMLTAAFNSVARTLLATVLSVFFASLVVRSWWAGSSSPLTSWSPCMFPPVSFRITS